MDTKMKVFAVANRKGGAAKTTTCVNLAHAAVERTLRVLLVDLDPQRNFSNSFPATSTDEASTALQLFADGVTIIPEVVGPGLSILRGVEELSMLGQATDATLKRFAKNLRSLAKGFDLCIIDTPGVLGMAPPMTISGLVAADAVLCPVAVGKFEAEAIRDLWRYVHMVKTKFNPRLNLMGLLPSRINTRSADEMEALAQLRQDLGAFVLPLMLSENAAVKKSIAQLKPVWRGIRGAGHKNAAREWREATDHLLNVLEAK
jgi:chromosome partitioning protein